MRKIQRVKETFESALLGNLPAGENRLLKISGRTRKNKYTKLKKEDGLVKTIFSFAATAERSNERMPLEYFESRPEQFSFLALERETEKRDTGKEEGKWKISLTILERKNVRIPFIASGAPKFHIRPALARG